jgi:hypothetical protein
MGVNKICVDDVSFRQYVKEEIAKYANKRPFQQMLGNIIPSIRAFNMQMIFFVQLCAKPG